MIMKTAEEWFNDFPLEYDALALIRAAQLDAMREGMRRAAHQVCKGDAISHREPYWFERILTAAEQLTEKDLHA